MLWSTCWLQETSNFLDIEKVFCKFLRHSIVSNESNTNRFIVIWCVKKWRNQNWLLWKFQKRTSKFKTSTHPPGRWSRCLIEYTHVTDMSKWDYRPRSPQIDTTQIFVTIDREGSGLQFHLVVSTTKCAIWTTNPELQRCYGGQVDFRILKNKIILIKTPWIIKYLITSDIV